ncbi:obscurin isoform X3 [Cimex lectularius]|nr:obscurin isoform X3 [Cimex lectularius]
MTKRGGAEVFTVSQDFKADEPDAVSVHRGEKVVLMNTRSQDPSKRVRFDFDLDLDFGMDVEQLLDTSAAKHKMSVKPKRNYMKGSSQSRWSIQSLEDPEKQGLVPMVLLTPHEVSPMSESMQDIAFRKEAVISELVETEEEFCRDLMQVVDRYIRPLDGPTVPRFVSDKKESLFGNFREIAIFHNTVLLEGIKYYAKQEPKALGRTFLRMERDFDKHAAYCHDEPLFQDFLQDNEDIRTWFEDLAARLHDDKNLSEHLKLPIQRINDYQLLLKELVRYSEKLNEDTTDLSKALELMLGIPHRSNDLKYINNIEGYHGDIHKLGRLLRHNWFKLKGKDGKTHERYLFLFKARILVCKVRKIGDGRYVFVLKEIIRLPEVEVKDQNDSQSFDVGPYTLTSHGDNAKEPWLAEIQHYARNALTLAEHAADDLRLKEDDNKNIVPLKGIELDTVPGQLSDEDMDKSTSLASRRTSLTKRVEELRSGSITESVRHEEVISSSVVIREEMEEDMTSRCITNQSLFIHTIEGLNVEPGGSAAFECEIDAKSIVWLKDNRPLSDRLADRVTQMSVGNVHRLEILNVIESDAGVYTAHATTKSGQVSTCTANLVVHKLTNEERKAKNGPHFLVRLKDTELLQNTYLRFLIKVKGDPMPTVEFFKDDKLITYKNERMCVKTEQAATGYYELVIPEVHTSDAGMYKCVATNRFGEATCEGLLCVVEDNKNRNRFESQAASTNQQYDKNIFESLDDKNIQPEFSWIKDGKPFDAEERFKVLFQDEEDSLALVFTHVKPEDAGLYTCVASTSTGKISCSAELTVQGNVNLLTREPEAAKIKSSTTTYETNIGSSAMLETKVTGYPKPEIKWFKEGEEIKISEKYKVLYEDDETSSLVIKNITLEDMGEYTVVASNLSGKSEDTVKLNVKAAPFFTKKLTDVHAMSSQEIRLNVNIGGNPKPTVAWYKDGKEVSESDHVKLIEEGSSYTLLIEKCNLYDVGSYSVICKNEVSQCSEFCKVDVEGAPIFTRTLIKNAETEEGDSLTFLVKVHGKPMPSVEWFYKNKPVVLDSRCKTSSDNDTYTLTINAINKNDAGEYSCRLTNVHGTATDHGQLFVKTAPVFIKGMGHLMAQEGDTNVGFTVEVASYPKGHIKWFHDDVEIKSNSSDYSFKEDNDSYTLVLKNVKRESYGSYKCKIENQYGCNDSTAELTVLCKPQFKKPLSDMTVNEGDTLTLKVEIDATPEPTVKWYKDGQELTEDAHIKISRDSHRVETYELTVNLVKAEDSGEYEVRAINEMGSAVTKNTVIVQKISTGDMSSKAGFKETVKEPDEIQEITMQVNGVQLPSDNLKNIYEKREAFVDYQEFIMNEEDGSFRTVTKHGFRCVEVSSECHLQESSACLVEEFSDSEDKSLKVGRNRGISIVSVDDDEENSSHSRCASIPKDVDSTNENPVILECQDLNTETTESQEKLENVLPKNTDNNDTSNIIEKSNSKLNVPTTQNNIEDHVNSCSVEGPSKSLTESTNLESLSDNKSQNEINDLKSGDSELKNGFSESHVKEEPISDTESELEQSFDIAERVPHDGKIKQNSESDTDVEYEFIKDEAQSTDIGQLSGSKGEELEPIPTNGINALEDECSSNTGKLIETMEQPENHNPSLADTNKSPSDQTNIDSSLKEDSKSDNKNKTSKTNEKDNVQKPDASPKVVKSEMKDMEVFECWEHKFNVEVDGRPHPTAKWYKDGKELGKSDRYKILDDNGVYSLEIINCQLDDSAEYKVVVSNVLGEASDMAKLKIIPANDFRLPQITTPLVNTNVNKGDKVELKVVLTADPIPEIKWQFNEKDVPSDFVASSDTKPTHHNLKECTYTLTNPSCKHENTGQVSFTAENNSGRAETSAHLDVILKPEVKSFKDIAGIPYEDAQFTAYLNSNPRAAVVWRKDGKKLENDDHYSIETDDTNEVYKLNIKHLLLEDGGTYTISAVNKVGECSADARLKIHMQEPEFTKGLEDIQVREYAQLDLKVRAQGVPNPEIQWSKDGEDLKDSEELSLETKCEGNVSSQLTIPHFKEENAGRYKVRAHNVAGHADTLCNVKLAQLAPTFSKSLGRALEVEEGEPLELRCKIEASPSAKIKWFKDGEELKPSDHIQVTHNPDGSVKLRIEAATPGDCGAYKIIVQNNLGEDASICAVAVNPNPRAPVFLKKLENVSVGEDEPMFLEAQVSGFPLPEIKWFKDGLPIRPSRAVNFINSPGGMIGLSVEKSASENAGTYSVQISNKLGDASCQAEVDVLLREHRPEFQGHLIPTTVVEGFPVKFSIKVGGNPPPELIWSKNNTPIDIDGVHVKVEKLPDGQYSLLIDKASPSDAGLYSVTAKNPSGAVTSEAKLEVADHARGDQPEEPPCFAYNMRDAWTEEGSSVTLTAPFLGNPIPEVRWFKEDKELKPDHRISFTNDGHKVGLHIEPCDMEDMSNYKCQIENPLGKAETSAKITVKKVYHAPVFVQKLHDLDQVIGLDGKLVCRVTGNPKPDISWFCNGKPIVDGNRYRMKREGDSCILYIKDCSPNDDGCYTCIASNRDGKDECKAQFRAVEKILTKEKGEAPCFLKKIGDQELIHGMTGRFTACISGFPEPEVEWFRNNEKLYPSERITIEREKTGLLRLCIAHVDPDVDAGKYKVRIYNDHGEDECEASFSFDNMGLGDRRPVGEQYKDFDKFKHSGAPMPLADRPIISRMSDRRLTLSWKPSIPYGPREPVTYQVEMCEVPNGDWFTARSGIRSCACEIRNLEPFRDYKFRVRVENKFGISDPSPYEITYRTKLEPEPPKFIPYLAPGVDFRPDSSPYFPKDFDIERPPHDGYAQAPKFLRQEHYTQYGVKNHNSNLFWFVYGYPKPKMTYYFNDKLIEMGGRYDCSYTRNGQATLFINKMLDRDVGSYEAVATNEHGEARQKVHLEIAEYPEFIKRPEEMILVVRNTGRLEARVVGVPQPDIKWFKDWQPLAPSSRIKINRMDPDHCSLTINDAIMKDTGLYSITASNVAGAVSCSVMIHVEEKDEYPFQHYGRGHNVKCKTKPISDYYDLGDELGRGTQGITYHAVERSTGRNYAAKIMHGRKELKTLMHNELEMMNMLNSRKIIKIHDAFETLDTVTLMMELASGGELLDVMTRQPYTTESEIASYIRQLLVALDYMHEQNLAHLGLTPGDLLVSHPGGDDLKLCDFGLARRIHPGQLQPLEFGMPEFVSPETIRGEGVDFSSDMWSVGVITYLLLTGVSLFRGTNDKETLTKVREGYWQFDEEYWTYLSKEARDFISKLLIVNTSERLDVKAALRHPWLNYADRLPPNLHNIPTEKLHNYFNLWKDWYSNASCRTWYRRRPLVSAFTHPSKMVYPPHYIATPMPSPEREIKDTDNKSTWAEKLSSQQPMNYDLGVISSESHYQNGPDTYLLQLRDVDFPVRIREYMKVAAHRGSGVSSFPEDNHLDWRLPVIRERRRFTDVMDEEIDDERKNRISQYGYGDTYTVRRLKHELGSRLDTHVEAEAIIEATRGGQAPFMREKPKITPIEEGKPVQLSCYAVGDPKPTIQWFKNDMMFGNSNRIKITEDDKGRSVLELLPASSVDAGIYKVVARNSMGQTVCRTRLVHATIPDAPDSPQMADVSDSQILLKWKQPKHDGNSPILSYSLQRQLVDGSTWKDVSCTIEHEFFLVDGLQPATGYLFRLASQNSIGWSEFGIPSEVMRTLEEGCEPIKLTKAMKSQQASEINEELKPAKHELDYSVETSPIQWTKQLPTQKYTFVSEISSGRFSVVVKAIDKTTEKTRIAKLVDCSPTSKPNVEREFEVLRSLCHERIATLFEAYAPVDESYSVFILEKLQGADVLTYLSSRHEYTEQMVATIISQVLDALQYLHWRCVGHLDLQPDNIVMASTRTLEVKLVDFGCAQRVTKLGNVVQFHGNLDYTAPEVLCQEPAYPQSDIWSVGVLAYVMLSGVSPFQGENAAETKQNINFVRFRYEYLYKELTQEATRFLMLVFKRAPNKRPSAEECQEHRWLLPSEYMIKRRERAVFLGNRIKEYSEKYHQARKEEVSSVESLTSLLTGKGALERSNSIQEELIATY